MYKRHNVGCMGLGPLCVFSTTVYLKDDILSYSEFLIVQIITETDILDRKQLAPLLCIIILCINIHMQDNNNCIQRLFIIIGHAFAAN